MLTLGENLILSISIMNMVASFMIPTNKRMCSTTKHSYMTLKKLYKKFLYDSSPCTLLFFPCYLVAFYTHFHN